MKPFLGIMAWVVLIYLGCSQPVSSPTPAVAPPKPAISGLPVSLTVQQRSTTAIPGTDGEISLTIDDITRGQVMVSLVDAGQDNLLGPVSMKHGESAMFRFGDTEYSLTLTDMMNELVGEDSATFTIEAGTPGHTEAEKILALIVKVEGLTDAAFIRNGDDHTPAEAAAHLRRKLDSAGDKIKTAEEFIEQIASKSSLSREEYQIRFSDGKTVTAGEFLREELRRLEREGDVARKNDERTPE